MATRTLWLYRHVFYERLRAEPIGRTDAEPNERTDKVLVAYLILTRSLSNILTRSQSNVPGTDKGPIERIALAQSLLNILTRSLVKVLTRLLYTKKAWLNKSIACCIAQPPPVAAFLFSSYFC